MDHIEIFQVDAFTDKVFYGNPAAVCLLNEWLNDELMQAIAVENNVSETAFIMKDEKGFHIRWFTPNGEINLCGHATLAAGFVLFELQKNDEETLRFDSLSGELRVTRLGDKYQLDFPTLNYTDAENPDDLKKLINVKPLAIYQSDLDYLIQLETEQDVAKAEVDLKQLAHLPKRGLILTSKAKDVDFYSRCFYPKHHIAEDPVTGSAHCVLTPFWASILNKKHLTACQGLHRKGYVFCTLHEDRVFLGGHCRWYSKGTLVL